jgi:hypothetical protein
MRTLLIIFFQITFFIMAFSQETFHRLIYLEFPVSRFTSVFPTDSCYYVIGTFTDSISPVRTGVLRGKLDSLGNLVSIKTIKHPDRLYFNDYGDLEENASGYLFNVGSVNDAPSSVKGVLYIYNNFGDTIITKKYDSVLFPDANFVLPIGIRQRTDEGYVIVNSHRTAGPQENVEISLLLLDSALHTDDYLVFGSSPKHEAPRSLLVDEDGGFLIGAMRTNNGQVLLNFSHNTLIIKTDSLGEVVWQYLSPPNILQDAARAMIKTPDGGLVVASGRGVESNSNPFYHNLFWDALIFKLDANQQVAWSTPLRGYLPTSQTALVEMVEATDGNGYVAAGVVADRPPGMEPYHDSWLVKVSPEGDSLWARHYAWFDGEFVAPEVWDMKATPDGGYVLVGFTANVNIHVPAWIMKVDSLGCLIPGCHLLSGAGEAEPEAIDLALYPNPATDLLNFQLRMPQTGQNAAFRILNAEGRVMRETAAAPAQTTFIVPVRDWPAGVYFLQYLEGGTVRAVKQFIKQ